jgi:hypothetical protein
MIFPHNEKIVTVDLLTHYDPQSTPNLDNNLPLIGENQEFFSYIEMSLGIFKESFILGTFKGVPPQVSPIYFVQFCTITLVTMEPSSPSIVPTSSSKPDQPPSM